MASFGTNSFVLDLIGSVTAIQGNFLGVHSQPGRVGALHLLTATYQYTPGREVPIFFEAGTGQRYEPGSQNIYAACINCNGNQSDTQTPEPMSLDLVCAGLIASWWVRHVVDTISHVRPEIVATRMSRADFLTSIKHKREADTESASRLLHSNTATYNFNSTST